MTLMDAPGYDEFKRHMRAEGVDFADLPLNDTTDPAGALPDPTTLKRLSDTAYREFGASDSARKAPIDLITGYWQRYNLQPYDEADLLLADQINVTTPLIRSRVDQAHGSLYGSLSMTPFFSANVDSGQDGTAATHAEMAFDEQLRNADWDNAFDGALRGSFVGTLGLLKFTVATDEQGDPRLDTESVDLRDLYLSPHNVRDLQQCTLIAQRYYEPLGWVKDQALAGLFDKKRAGDVIPSLARDATDGGNVDRDQHHLPESEGLPTESGMVELLEVYVRARKDKDSPTEMWRMIVARSGWVVLRAERWEDGFPFWPLRHQRGTSTLYAPSFASVLKDLQFGKDMLFSLSFEADRASVTPYVEYDQLSPAAAWIEQRAAESKNRTARILPGDLVPGRGGQQSLRFTYSQPANMAVAARENSIESMAGSATIPSLPMQTYRSATEHRFAQAGVTSKESQMLKVVRADLSRAAEYAKRLYWKYVAEPFDEENKYVQHGSQKYLVNAATFLALRFEPRGMTTQADQMQVAAASGEALQLTLTLAAQKPLLMQSGQWPQVYAAARLRLEALGFREWRSVLGEPPTTDPKLIELDPAAREASMALMQAQAGQMPMMGQPGGMAPGMGGEMRGSDAAPTVAPGGNPLMPGAPGSVN